MDDLLREGADAAAADDLRREARDAAGWLWDFCAPGYGPRGAWKLVAGEALLLASSPASALREADPAHPALAPYLRLAEGVQAARGDGATTALLLAAAVVRRALDAGGPVQPLLEGVRAARRQAAATLSAHAREAPAGDLLRGVVPERPDWPEVVLDGLRRLSQHGRVDLDALDVRPEPGETLRWDDGLVVEPQAGDPGPGRRPAVRVALVHGVRKTTATDAGLRVRAPSRLEDARWRLVADRVAALGVGFLLSSTALPDDLRGALLDRGVLVQENVTRSLAWRVAVATGASPVPSPEMLDAAALGVADLERRPGRPRRRPAWWLRGPGVSATLCVPAGPGAVQEARVDDVERLLRAAGTVLEDPRGVPGGGRWQQAVESSLRSMAPHLPGRAQLGAGAVADALRDLRRALVRNAGLDPLDVALPPAPEGLLDGHRVVRDAVDGALATAEAVLRLDGRFRKRGSAAVDLRGGTGPMGSPKGMPGDVPPHM